MRPAGRRTGATQSQRWVLTTNRQPLSGYRHAGVISMIYVARVARYSTSATSAVVCTAGTGVDDLDPPDACPDHASRPN